MAKYSGLESVLPYKLPSASQLIYVKTNIAGYFFDAVMDVQHTHSSKITSHPVQSGANISDHVYNEPVEVTMTIIMSDVMAGIIKGQFIGTHSRSISAYNMLRELQKQRIPFQITTRLEVYQNMIIETLSVPDDVKTLYGLEVKVSMKQILMVNVKTIKISKRINASNSTNYGTVKTSDVAKTTIVNNRLKDKL